MSSKAQIVATIGPATKSVDMLEQMMNHGMDVARLNFSHGTYDEHSGYIQAIREAAQRANKTVPILQDLSGPRKTTGEGHEFSGSGEAITDKDIKDLDFGIAEKVEYVVLSYVGEAGDIEKLRGIIKEKGGNQKIIAKIERPEGVENIDNIIEASDGIMIGRGDLGQSMPIEKVPFIQFKIIQKCNAAKKPVITATHMLLSMTENTVPTRAEVSDVANAILNGTDAVMLSEETAIGQHPFEVIEIMEKIVLEAENHIKTEYNLIR